jgi:predicted nuclease with TOPRIM domain
VFSKYDALKEEIDRLRKSNTELASANEKLSKTNMEMKGKENDLLLRISELEVVSDDVLISRIQSWLNEHNYEINIADFARINRVSEPRVEELLNRMVREGYLSQRD